MKKIYGVNTNTSATKPVVNKPPINNSVNCMAKKFDKVPNGYNQLLKTPLTKPKEIKESSTADTKSNSKASEDNSCDADYYVKCWNCDSMILMPDVDKHSRICTEQSQASIQRSFLPVNDQLNIQIENIKKLVYLRSHLGGDTRVWDECINIMNVLQSLNDFTNVTIMTLRKQINSIKMLSTCYKGTYSGLLLLNKTDVIAKQKYEHVVTNYKKMYSKQMLKDNNDQIKKMVMEGRLSNYTSNNSNSPQNNSMELDPSKLFNNADINKSQDFGTSRDNKVEDTLKRQFYYKCITIKKKLSKTSLGFWVESAPLYNYARNNKIPVTEWDKFIEQELTTNVLKWIDPQQLEKLELINQKRKSSKKTKLNTIEEDK